MPTTKQLARFLKKRRNSCFSSNWQFGADADVCGFSVDDLGDPIKFEIDGFIGYQWDITVKDRDVPVRMIEYGRNIGLDFDPESIELMEFVKRKYEQGQLRIIETAAA